ncbi:MAG: TIR domain-containing protein [candidate division Zixibacteria bacterium]|nr:TIR domain-containing protein [candidate division Zixibacteria bacterium]
MTREELLEIIDKAEKDKLTILDLSERRIKELPAEIGKLVNLKKLILSRNILKTLPPEIGLLINLKEFYLSFNQLTILPPEFGSLRNLTKCNVESNELTSLPAEISRLKNLKYLYLSHNKLESLPPEIGQLSEASSIVINNNQLKSLPIEIGQLENLVEFSIGSNQLRNLPHEIGNLTKLELLYITDNRLTSLPPEIGRLTHLMLLSISDNQLISLSPELSKIEYLRVLHLSNNPDLVNPPPEIIKKGTKAVLEYLQLFKEEGEERQYQAKLIFAGENAVGKTSTISRLIGDSILEKKTTHGISIDTLVLDHPSQENEKIDLSIWDFSSKLFYHGTHQLFFTDRSIYVLCWDSQRGPERCNIDYWLGAIHVLAPESPIILVSTHIDTRMPDINYRKYLKNCPQLIANCAVSNKTNDGIDELRKAIEYGVINLPQMGESCPKRWMYVRDWIKVLKEDHYYIRRQEYLEICAKFDIDDKSIWILADWLHNLGEILVFYKDIGLEDIVILQPEWITQAISKVLEDEYTRDKKYGILEHDRLSLIWSDYDKSMHPAFLRLMEKFDLSYCIQGRGTSLIAELLPYQPPVFEWPDVSEPSESENQLTMIFELNFVPDMLMSRFIVKSHRFSVDLHWREGVILKYNGNKALVELDNKRHTISLEVRGKSPYNFYNVLNDVLNSIFASYPGIEIKSTSKPIEGKPKTLLKQIREETGKKLKVFLSYAIEDSIAVRTIYDDLVKAGVTPWFAEEILLPGQNWKYEILKALKASHIVIICLSSISTAKESYFQTEIREALDIAKEKPKNTIFIVPIKLEECEIPIELEGYHCPNIFEEKAFERLLKSISVREKQVMRKENRKRIKQPLDTNVNNKQMADLIIRNFIRQHNIELTKLEADCPSLVTITPRDSGILRTVRENEGSLFSTAYDVQLWCQMPGCCHPLVDGDYELQKPKDWLIKIKPWLKVLIESLKFIDLAAPVIGSFISESVKIATAEKIDTMEKLANCLPDIDESSKEHEIQEHEKSYLKIGGADLRMIHKLLDHLDPSHKWGGLRKTISPEGDILWLCKKHYMVFDPDVPVLKKSALK